MIAILYGSRATGHEHAHSDWDVGVLLDHPLHPDERADLRRAFAAKLGTSEDDVDIADLTADAPLLRYQVARDGRLIAGDPQEFRKFQIRAWKDYLNNEKMFSLAAKFLDQSLS